MVLGQVREDRRGEGDRRRCGRARARARRPPSRRPGRRRRASRAGRACRSIASGVVRSTGRSSPADHRLDRAEQPALRPAGLEQRAHRYAVVVLPLVPVTPTTCSSRAGRRRSAPRAAPSRRARTAPAPRARRARAGARRRARRRRRDRLRRERRGRRRVKPLTQKNSVAGRHRAAVVGQSADLDRACAVAGPIAAMRSATAAARSAEPHPSVPGAGIGLSLVSAPAGAVSS